jgi:hypothetical protein
MSTLFYKALPKPTFLFAKGGGFHSPVEGLKKAGPFNRKDCPARPSLLFVFSDSLKPYANKLFLALKNGVGPFRGTGAFFGFQLETANTERVESFATDFADIHASAAAYRAAIEKFLAQKKHVDLALIIHPKTERAEQDNPYLTAKYPLLKANIPTQVVTTDLIDHPDTFQWSAANIALAMFAKMGGVPWAVETGLTDDTLVIGIGRANIATSGHAPGRRIYGFASTFSHKGVYLGTKIFSPASDWTTYLRLLKESVGESLRGWKEQVKQQANLVLHVQKETGREELAAIQQALQEQGAGVVKSFTILKLSEMHDVLLFNPKSDTGIPAPGIFLPLDKHRGLLQVAGIDAKNSPLGRVVTSAPLQVRLVTSSSTTPSWDVLCSHILALSAMNWRGLNADSSVVTLSYPRVVAEFFGRFEEAGFDVSALGGVDVMKRPWFL